MGTTKDKLNKILESKNAIKSALINKGVKNVDDILSNYSSFIMQVPTGSSGTSNPDFSKIGYTSAPTYIYNGYMYGMNIKNNWNASLSTHDYSNDLNLTYFPQVDLSKTKSLLFNGCKNLLYVADTLNTAKLTKLSFENSGIVEIPALNLSACTDLSSCFVNTYIKELPELNTAKCENFQNFMTGSHIEKITGIDISKATNVTNAFNNPNIVYMVVNNIGLIDSVTLYDFSNLKNWGLNNSTYKNAEQSVIDTLVGQNLYNRKKNGLSKCTLKIPSNAANILTHKHKNNIKNKGYTLTII